jgi:hypothetical protein
MILKICQISSRKNALMAKSDYLKKGLPETNSSSPYVLKGQQYFRLQAASKA